MPKRKKDLKQKLSEFTYNKPSLDKRFSQMKHGIDEVSALLNNKKEKR